MYLMAALQIEMEFGVVMHGLHSPEGAQAWGLIEERINRWKGHPNPNPNLKFPHPNPDWKGHPGLLGWYVCDDCFGQYLMRQQRNTPNTTLDQLYDTIKARDPHHTPTAVYRPVCGFV